MTLCIPSPPIFSEWGEDRSIENLELAAGHFSTHYFAVKQKANSPKAGSPGGLFAKSPDAVKRLDKEARKRKRADERAAWWKQNANRP